MVMSMEKNIGMPLNTLLMNLNYLDTNINFIIYLILVNNLN